MPRETEYVELSFYYETDTDSAICVSDDTEEYWIPLSCLSESSLAFIHHHNLDRGDGIEIEVAEWFALKKGLI